MKLRIWNFGLVLMLATAFVFGACGNALEGGSSPSGTILRVQKTDPGAFTVDVIFNACGEDTFEKWTAEFVQVDLLNDSRPNSPTATNSYVTINRYRVDFAVLDLPGATLPSIDGGGIGIGVEADGTVSFPVLVIDQEIRSYVNSHFPEVGVTRSMRVRADITIWGVDAFNTTVKAEPSPSVTMVFDNFDSCSGT